MRKCAKVQSVTEYCVRDVILLEVIQPDLKLGWKDHDENTYFQSKEKDEPPRGNR